VTIVRTIRPKIIAVVLTLVLALAAAGCGERMVKVQTGERVVCTYGEVVSSTVKTIEVPASKVTDYKVVTKTVTCSKHKAIEALYAAAQKAIQAGDLKTARGKLAEVLALDANFRKAAEQATQIDAGTKPVPDAGTGGTGSTTPTPPGGGVPEGPVASLSVWVPDALAGYKADPVEADSVSLTRQYVPSGSKPVSSLVVVAEQYKDAGAAKAAASSTIAGQYSTGRATVTVKGRAVLFGTMSSKQFAAIAWNEGAVLIVVEAYSSAGGAGGLKDELASVAAALIP
jgi:hypothetical protein